MKCTRKIRKDPQATSLHQKTITAVQKITRQYHMQIWYNINVLVKAIPTGLSILEMNGCYQALTKLKKEEENSISKNKKWNNLYKNDAKQLWSQIE